MSKFKMAAIAALCVAVGLPAFTFARRGGPASSADAPDPKVLEALVYANRILSDQGVVDAFGHVSARDDKDPNRFLLARSVAPALVTTGDILEFDRNGEPIDARGRGGELARRINAAV